MMLGASGVEIRDDETCIKGPGEGNSRLVASFGKRAEAERVHAELADREPSLDIVVDEIVGDAWREAYKEHFKPFALTERLVVVPSWEDYEPRSEQLVLKLDPGRAFGTGLHATTVLVADQLDRRSEDLSGVTVLDVGTGSGILALAALRLGAERAVAVDTDAGSVEVARENADRCGLADRVQIDTTLIDAVPGRYPFVVANIRSNVLLGMAGALCERLAPGGWLVLSGVLASEEDEVRDGFVAQGLDHVETARRGDKDLTWVAIVLRRAP
jgi:ribosomal protein L11 methyltransferase